MSWKEAVAKATRVIKDAAESDTATRLASKARATASSFAQKARDGVLDAAQSFVEANADPAAFKIQYMNLRMSVISPSDGFEIGRPDASTLVVSDGENNGLVIDAAAEPAYVVETIGRVVQLNANSYDLGAEDGVNVVVIAGK